MRQCTVWLFPEYRGGIAGIGDSKEHEIEAQPRDNQRPASRACAENEHTEAQDGKKVAVGHLFFSEDIFLVALEIEFSVEMKCREGVIFFGRFPRASGVEKINKVFLGLIHALF